MIVDSEFSNAPSDGDSIRSHTYGHRQNTAESSEDQDSCEEYFSATEGNERIYARNISEYHKSSSAESPSDTLIKIFFKEPEDTSVVIDSSLRSNNPQKKNNGLIIVDNESAALSCCKQGSLAGCSEKLELKVTRNVAPVSSRSHFVNWSPRLYGKATSLPTGVSVTASGPMYTNKQGDVKSDMNQECSTAEMKSIDDPSSLNQSAINDAKPRFKADFRSCDRLSKEVMFKTGAECTPSGSSQYRQHFEICDELPPLKPDQLERKSSSSSDDDDDDENECDGGVNVAHFQNPKRVNNKARVTESEANVFPSDENSRLVYMGQGCRSKKDNLVVSDTTVKNLKEDMQSKLSFTLQSARPKEVEQSVNQKVWNLSNLSSAENAGLESAFLARHSRDISLPVQSNPKSNDLSLSTQCNFSETTEKLQQQQLESEVEREEIRKETQKQSETAQLQQQKARTLNDQSGDDFQFTLNPNQSTEPGSDTTSSKIMPCPSNNDINTAPLDCTGDFLGNSFATKNSNFSKDRVQDERFSYTNAEQDTNSEDLSNDKALCSSEEKSKNFEGELQPKHEIQGSEGANVTFSQSQGESSSTLQAQVAEACALIESVYKERKAVEMEARNRQKKLQEEWRQAQKEKEERNLKEKEVTVDKGDVGASAVNDGSKLEDCNEKYPVQESPEWLCEHYRRRCKVKFSCCNVFHACHR